MMSYEERVATEIGRKAVTASSQGGRDGRQERGLRVVVRVVFPHSGHVGSVSRHTGGATGRGGHDVAAEDLAADDEGQAGFVGRSGRIRGAWSGAGRGRKDLTVQRINDIVGQLSKDTLASIEFIRLSDYDRHDVATDVATELLVYALYKTGAEVTDIRLFMRHVEYAVTERYYDFLAKTEKNGVE